MNQKHLFKKLLVLTLLCALILLAGCNEKSPAPDPPLTTEVIDLSNDGLSGYGFGDGPGVTLEMKRWQTFIATSAPVVTAVEVKLQKIGSGTYTPVLVELYKTDTDCKPIGQRLAYGLISPDWIGTGFTVVRTGLSYNGLVAGKQYAIVLTQGVPSNAHYEWLTKAVNDELHFGKYTGDLSWVDESGYGDGWLKVYVASKTTRPTRIFIYNVPVKSTGNLKGLYADARTGADFMAANRPLSLAGKTSHAFISISTTDCIANMPGQFGFPDNIPIVMVTDDTKIIADNWDDLLDGSIKISLTEACGLTGNHGWWSGSNIDGTCDVSTTNCNGWTDGSGSITGMAGQTDSVDDSWIRAGFGTGNGPRYVLGIAY